MGIKDFLQCNLNRKDMEIICTWPKDSFWHDVFDVWCEWNFATHPQGKENIINQPIWYNSLVRIGKKP